MSASVFLQRFGTQEQPEVEAAVFEQPASATDFINRFAGFLEESYWFYNNTVEIKFDRTNHVYYRVGDLGELIPVLNVSTVSKIIDRSPALIPWAAKVTIEKLLRTVPTVEAPGPVPTLVVPGMTFEEFTKLAMVAKTAHSDRLEDAGEVGKMAHDWIENYIKAVMANDQASIQGLMTQMCSDPRATNCALAALGWMKAHNVRWLDTERKVFSKKHDCSGTLDGRCIVDSCDDPSCCPTPFKDRKSLLDWKTSNFLYIEFVYQASAYFYFFLEEFPQETLEDIWILRLGKEDGEFQPWHLEVDEVPACFEGFLACLALKRIVGETEEHMKERKILIREAKKKQRAEEKERRKAEEKEQKRIEKEKQKAERLAEKERIKAEAKAERERLKAEKKAAKENPCTSSEVIPLKISTTEAQQPTRLGTTPQMESGLLKSNSPQEETVLQETMQDSSCTISTEATETLVLTEEQAEVVTEALLNSPAPVDKAVQAMENYRTTIQQEEEVEYVFRLPMED